MMLPPSMPSPASMPQWSLGPPAPVHEFESQRRPAALLARIAALLLSISRNNAYEGRDAAVISDQLEAGVVADLLGVERDMLAWGLRELRRRGLLQPNGRALQLTDLVGLERLADGIARCC